MTIEQRRNEINDSIVNVGVPETGGYIAEPCGNQAYTLMLGYDRIGRISRANGTWKGVLDDAPDAPYRGKLFTATMAAMVVAHAERKQA